MDEEILSKLTTLVRLQALAMTRDLPTNKEKILFLHDAGLAPKEIAEIIGTTSNSVSVLLSREKKKNSEGKANGESK